MTAPTPKASRSGRAARVRMNARSSNPSATPTLGTGPARSVRPARAGGATGRPHVAIVVQNLPVPLDRRVWSESRALVAAGYDVTVVCPAGPGDPKARRLDGVEIRTYKPAPPARNVVGYLWEFAYCWLRTAILVANVHRRHRIDVLQACNPPDTYWLLALLLRPFGVRYVFDHHDLCPELYQSRPDTSGGPLLRPLLWLERRTYRTADHVIATNESYKSTACARHWVDPRRVTVVRSGPDPEAMRRGAPDPALRKGRAHLCAYLGVMGQQDGVDLVVRAADIIVNELGRRDCHFAMLGFGDCEQQVRQLAHDLGLDEWVTFTGRAELPTIQAYLSTATVGLAPDPKTPFNDLSTMNKTLEYLSFSLPVVTFDLRESRVSAGPAASYVDSTGDAPTDARRFAEAIVELLDDPERREQMGAIGRSRIEQTLGWPAQAPVYVDAFDRLVGIERQTPQEIPTTGGDLLVTTQSATTGGR